MRPTRKVASLRIMWTHIACLCMTGFVKIDPNHTRSEIHFIAEHKSLTLALARNTKHMAIDSQVCFQKWPFAVPVRPPRYTTRFLGSVNGIKRIWVVPDCCQPLSWLILWIVSVSVTYWRHSTAVCVLMEDITRLQLSRCFVYILLVFIPQS